MDDKKTIAVLGATGSVGRQALEVAEDLGADVALLSAHSSVDAMEAAARRHHPHLCAMTDPLAARELSVRLADTDIPVLSGEEGLCEAIAMTEADVFVNSILGRAGLLPSLAVVDRGARLALANKESMVVAGEIVRARAAATGAELLPVDSEHSAIFQCLGAGKGAEVRRIFLTASGGPFRGYDRARLAGVTREHTLAHPTWQMGAKITVDSATLANKGFEVIEAVRLFDVAPEQIEVVVHPESIIHSAVEYIDNTVIAEMSVPDMRSCVQYAVTYPDRVPGLMKPLDLFAVGHLSFERPDPEAFPLLPLAFRAVKQGGAAPAILNAADEVAVAAFLRDELDLLGIFDVVCETVALTDATASDLEGILAADAEARRVAAQLAQKHKKG